MDVTPSVVERAGANYREEQPLFAVEEEHLEMLPKAFASGDYGWRDAEWVVQWYFRRFLGAYPDGERRSVEEAYGENSYEAVHEAISTAVDADDAAAKLEPLLALEGVDVSVASAFLGFIDPDRFLVVGEREWEVLRAAGELSGPYPDPPAVADYERYLATSRQVADRVGCDLQTLYRTYWLLGREEGYGPGTG